MIKYRCMSLYVPYSGQSPAAITINGHRLIILAQNKEMLQAELGLLNADRLQAIDLPAGEAQRSAIDDISRAIHGGVVIAPANVQLQEIIKSLEGELPWVQ